MSRILKVVIAVILALFILALAASVAVAQGPKREGTATTLAVFLPGAGHLYAGETGKGLTLLAGAVGGTALAVHSMRCETVTETFPGGGTSSTQDCGPRTTALAIGSGVAVAVWVYSLLDADNAVRRVNARRLAPTVGVGVGRVDVGVRLALGGRR